MGIVSVGLDIAEVERVGGMLDRHGERFLLRCFTEGERAYCLAQAAGKRAQHLAARFAAKEAVLKALGTGLADGISWLDIEVVRDDAGRPTVRLSGRAAERAAGLGIQGWRLSLTHTRATAAAVVVATSRE